MDFIIIFFRDILNGPLYIVVAIISGILICSCIGYLAEQSELKKKNTQKQESEYAKIPNQNIVASPPSAPPINNNVVNTTQNVQQGIDPNIFQNGVAQNLQSSTQQTPKV